MACTDADAVPAGPGESWTSLRTAFDQELVLNWLFDRGDVIDELRRNAFALTRKLREYEVPAYVVESADEAVVQQIFDRLNAYGKRISRAEAFHALHAATEPSDRPIDLKWLQREVALLGFGALRDDTVLKAVLARRGGDVLREIRGEFERGDVKEAPEHAFRATLEALRGACAFVQGECGVPHVRLLPYEFLIVTLCRFFAHHPHPNDRNRVRLRRWFWRAAMAGPPAQGGYTTAMRAYPSAVDDRDESASVEALLARVPDQVRHPPIDRFRLNDAAARMGATALVDLGPIDPVTGAAIDLAAAFEDRGRPFGRLTAAASADHSAGLVDRALLPPGSEVESMLSVFDEAGRTVLASHGIPVEAYEALRRADDAAGFLRIRHEHLSVVVQQFLDASAELDHDDRRAIAELTVEDDPDDDAPFVMGEGLPTT